MKSASSKLERTHDCASAVNADGWHQDWQVQAGGRKRCQSFATTRNRTNQTHRVQELIAQGVPTGTLFGLLSLRREAADVKEMLEEGQGSVEPEVGIEALWLGCCTAAVS